MQKAASSAKAGNSTLFEVGRLVARLLVVGVLLTVVIVAALSTHRAHAATNSTINFQARVLRASGSVIPDGNVNVQFKLYDAASGGANPWTEDDVVAAKNGYITVSLGANTPFPGTIDWSQELWLTMNVNGDGEMGPTRMKVTGVPYSFRSGQADVLTNGSGTITAAGLVQLAPSSIQDVNSANSALRVNQQGAGGLLQLQSGGSDVFTVSNSGAVVISSGITVGNSNSTVAGTIRWNGTAFEGHNGYAWTPLGGPGGPGSLINKVKQSNEIVNNSIGLQDDDELYFAIGAHEEWTYRFVVQARSSTTADLRFAVTAPSGATCYVTFADHEGATSNGQYGCGVTTQSIAGNGATDLYEITGSVNNGATPGAVTLQWAQFTLEATDTTVYSGSYVQAIRSIGAGSSGQVFVQDGNAFGETAILGTSDNNNLAVVTNGLERITVLSDGSVGIGDTTPTALFTVGTNDALQVNASGDLLTTGTLSVGGLTSLSGGLDNNSGGITEAGDITGVGTNLTASGSLTISATGANNLTLSTSGLLVLNANTLSRTAAGNTTLDLVDTSDTSFMLTNSGTGNANFGVDGSMAIGATPNANNKLVINAPNTADTSAQEIIYTNATTNKGLVIQTYAGQSVNAFEVQNNNGVVLGGFDDSGQLILGNDAATPQAGLIAFNDTGGANGFTAILGVNTLSDNRNIYLPDEGGTLCASGSANCGFVQFASGTVQTDATTNPSIFINKTGASGNMMTLQDGGTTVLSVLNSGALEIQLTDAAAFNVKDGSGNGFFSVDTSAGFVRIGGTAADGTGVLLLLDLKNTDGDPTGQEGAMYYNSANGSFRCYQNSRGWTDCLGVPKPNTRRVTNITYQGSGTTFLYPQGDIVTAGTGTAVGATTSEPAMLNYATSTTNGNSNGINGNQNYNTSANPSFQTHIQLPATASMRVWAGMTNQLRSTMSGSNNPAGNFAAFRYDTATDGTTWRCVVKNNVTINAQNTGVTANTTGVDLEIILSGTNAAFKINGVEVCNLTTQLPQANIMLRYSVSVTNLAGGATRSMRIGWIYLDSDR